jgi:hypothetical protein
MRQALKNFWAFISTQERRQVIYWLSSTVALIIFYVVVDSTYPLELEVFFYILGAYIIDSVLFFATWRQMPKIGNAMLTFLTILLTFGVIYYFLLGYTVI